MPAIPNEAYLIGGPRGGERVVIPGLLQVVYFPAPLPDDYWATLMSLEPDELGLAAARDCVKIDAYNLLGVVKLYEYGGRS